jgi:hypothetical protein
MFTSITRLLTAALVCAILLPMSTPAATETPGVYRHVVLLKFKPEATPAQIAEVETAFRALKQKINTITSLEWGTDISPEGKAEGFTHCFFLTFKDKAGVDVYLPHPDHKAFGGVLRPVLDKVLVIDYISKE